MTQSNPGFKHQFYINSQVEQTAVAAPQQEAPLSGDTDSPLAGVQLRNLSIEHAAIALQLDATERTLVMSLAQGRQPRGDEATQVHALMKKTRMTRLSLAVLGYQLLGQESIEWKAAA